MPVTSRFPRHSLEWKLMALSLAMLGGAGWNAIRLAPPVGQESAAVSVTSAVWLGSATSPHEWPLGESVSGKISTSNAPSPLPTLVAIKEEK